MSNIKISFINEVIQKRKKLNILYNENYLIINMDETSCLLEMSLYKTLDFIYKRKKSVIISGREHYRISVILSITSKDIKLHPLIIVKGQPWKSIEKELNNMHFVKEKIHVYCQNDGCCISFIFKELIKNIFIEYEKEIPDKCLLIIDKAISHISKDSL